MSAPHPRTGWLCGYIAPSPSAVPGGFVVLCLPALLDSPSAKEDVVLPVDPKDKINEILNVQCYIAQWPLIPVAELHASSIRHPDDAPCAGFCTLAVLSACLAAAGHTLLAEPNFQHLLAWAIKMPWCGAARFVWIFFAAAIQGCRRCRLRMPTSEAGTTHCSEKPH